MPDFRIIKFQSSIFTPDFIITNSLNIANIAIKTKNDIFNGKSSILPVPQDAPAEIPRIILSSSDSRWSLNISAIRTNLFYNSLTDQDTEIKDIEVDKFSSISSEFFYEFKKELNLRVQRLAYVTDRVIIREDALNYILENFCKENQIKKGGPLYNAKRFEIHSFKKYPWKDFSINSWVRIKFINFKKKENEFHPAILVTNDLNTLSYEEDKEMSFEPKKIKEYFEKVPNHLDGILKLYFS